MASQGSERHSGRETRLLILVVGVSLAVLLLLARLRFPSANLSVVTPSAAPLAGLAARATFDEMTSTMSDVLARVSGVIATVEFGPDAKAPKTPAGRVRPPVPAPADADDPAAVAPSRLLPALRVGRDVALVHVPAGWHPISGANLDGPISIVASDERTEMALIRVPSSAGFPDGLAGALKGFTGLSYVAVIEAMPGGLSVQPVFVGRADAVSAPDWPQPLLAVSAHVDLQPGELLFAVNGRLIGMTTGTAGTVRIVPPETLEALAAGLAAKGAVQ